MLSGQARGAARYADQLKDIWECREVDGLTPIHDLRGRVVRLLSSEAWRSCGDTVGGR